MISARDITTPQVIDFLNEHGRVSTANYKAAGETVYIVHGCTYPESRLLDAYAGRVAERLNRQQGFTV